MSPAERKTSGLPDRNEVADLTRRISRLSWLLDESIRVPGGFRIGLDGIIGLIPGLGDVAGLAASTYILYLAAQAGAGKAVLLRMSFNVLLETAIGSIGSRLRVARDDAQVPCRSSQRRIKLS